MLSFLLPPVATPCATPIRPPKMRLNACVAGLFGTRLVGDVRERLCIAGFTPPLTAARRARLQAIRSAGLLFIHVPKNAGMSISSRLYGQQVKHASVRYYDRVAPDIIDHLPSFALIRDPVDRFLSAFRYARSGGTAHNRVSPTFRDTYLSLTSLDDAIAHLETARSLYHVDHIFRPQSWYITNRHGVILVERLLLMQDIAQVETMMPARDHAPLPHINRSTGHGIRVTPAQLSRIRALYAADVALYDRLRAQRAWPLRV
jgi:hypothetical protein